MTISELLTVSNRHQFPLPDFQNGDEIRFPGALVSALLDRFTKSGDAVFDPFVGLARISQSKGCIGAANLRNCFCY
ncbi:hypothetical protein OS035_06485, partial [Rhizobium sp. 268]